jgi:outer membrane protein OmpA-like peptidoglycan-associated protein
LPGGAPFARRAPPTVTAPIPPAPPPAQALAPIAPGAARQGPQRMDDFRGERRETDQGGRRVFTEPGRVIVVDPSGQSFIRHNEVDRFRYGARDIQTQRVGNDTRTVVIRPDGSEIITVNGPDGQLLRRSRRFQGQEIVIIDNSYRDPRAVGGFYVDLPPPVIRIPRDRYIVESESAPPELIYETMLAPPVERIARRYSLDEIRYSPSVRQLMPSIDLDTINFELGSWEIPQDQASKLQVIADGLNRAISRNPREVFLIEGHTDATGNDVDNLSLSDRRAQSAAELLTQQFQVPAENLTSQGYGSQFLKEQTDGPSRLNRRVTVRRITPLLNGGQASLPPPPPGTAPPRR